MFNFIIIGTSKSLSNDIYYTKERLKVWGTIFIAGAIENYWKSLDEFSNQATRAFANSNNFDFYDIIPFIEKNDRFIPEKLSNLGKQITLKIHEEIRDRILIQSKSLMFNGKQSFYYFSFFFNNESFEISEFRKHTRKIKLILKELDENYGKLDENSVEKIFGLTLSNCFYILPNTSSRIQNNSFDEFIWIESIMKSISKNI
jgi:hypothetical protein